MKIIGLVYAKWCPHCTAMKPQWDIMKSKLRPNCRVVEIEDSDYDKQTKLDNLNNDITSDEKLQIHGYPTMFKINNGKVDYYNGSRDLTSMESFFNGPKTKTKSKTQKKNKTKKGKKSKKNKTKKMKGGEVKIDKNAPMQVELLNKFLSNLTVDYSLDDCEENIVSSDPTKICKKPNSKSDQVINICTSKVYKGPSKDFTRDVKSPLFNSRDNITIDPQTMNLLVQTVIKKIAPNRNIEQYDSICKNEIYEYALVGKLFSSNKNKSSNSKSKAISVEEYIEAINKEGDTADKQNECNKIIGWLRSVFENLDFLFKEIQFHHCDPKAAQLFLDGDTVILGDLDKVTFTLNIEQTPYRMRLSWGDAVKNKSGYNYVKKKIGYGGSFLGSQLKSISSISSSEPEKMRFESKPRKTNIFEKAAFMASILLQLNKKLYDELINTINAIKDTDDDIKTIYDKFINKKILKIKRNKQKKTGHAIASICVDNGQVVKNENLLKDEIILKSNASLVEKKDGDLVIEYNWW